MHLGLTNETENHTARDNTTIGGLNWKMLSLVHDLGHRAMESLKKNGHLSNISVSSLIQAVSSTLRSGPPSLTCRLADIAHGSLTHYTAPARLKHLLLWGNSSISLHNFRCLICTSIAERRSSPVLIITTGTIQFLRQTRTMATPPPTVRWKASLRLNNKGQWVGREGEFPSRFSLAGTSTQAS